MQLCAGIYRLLLGVLCFSRLLLIPSEMFYIELSSVSALQSLKFISSFSSFSASILIWKCSYIL
jgi:hypothetical protein